MHNLITFLNVIMIFNILNIPSLFHAKRNEMRNDNVFVISVLNRITSCKKYPLS
jgi:hypothetical protein